MSTVLAASLIHLSKRTSLTTACQLFLKEAITVIASKQAIYQVTLKKNNTLQGLKGVRIQDSTKGIILKSQALELKVIPVI